MPERFLTDIPRASLRHNGEPEEIVAATPLPRLRRQWLTAGFIIRVEGGAP